MLNELSIMGGLKWDHEGIKALLKKIKHNNKTLKEKIYKINI